jgi:hypothetical protein
MVQKPAAARSALNGASGQRANSSSALQPKDAYYTQCFCVSSWFRVPEQGMDTFELLSRASGFLVPRAGGEGGVGQPATRIGAPRDGSIPVVRRASSSALVRA